MEVRLTGAIEGMRRGGVLAYIYDNVGRLVSGQVSLFAP